MTSTQVVTMVVAMGSLACSQAADRRASDSASSPSEIRQPLVNKIEHFYATAPEAERLFRFFRDTLGLSEVWGFQAWGDFASGGVSLGNVAFEFAQWTPDNGQPLPTEFSGIAFEPFGDTDAAVAELTRRGIAHSKPDSNVYRTASGRMTGWVNTGLAAFLSGNVFLCDYRDRSLVRANRQSASDTLAGRGGGSLGIRALREIVIGVTDLDADRRHWRRLVDSSAQEADGRFTFGPGPAIRLVPAATATIQSMVLQVHSLERARSFLAGRHLLGDGDSRSVTIAPSAIDGLRVILVAK